MFRINYPYLNDTTFLKEIDLLKNVKQYAKITKLSWDENPIKEIQGIFTGGSININGNSSVRRTCNLSLFVGDEQYNGLLEVNNLISINTKIFVEIGIKNNTQKYIDYDILWFPLGLFVIIEPSISRDANGINISIQGQDKMCLLNGTVGGTLPASVQFDKIETINENGEWIIETPTIEQIIREAVNHWGGEQLGRIIISDIPNQIKQVMKWIGSIPVYLIDIPNENDQHSYLITTNEADASKFENKRIFNYGEDLGFIYTDFTYPSQKDLIIDAGGTVTNLLDQIIGVLGNYEYFYDIYGNFIFQEKKNYLNTTQSTTEALKLKEDINYLIDMTKGKSVYNFDDSTLITSYSNNPNYSQIKNDFIVWGIRKNANGNELPIRYHLSIDNRPKIGNEYQVFDYYDTNDKLVKQKSAIKFKSLDRLKETAGAADVFYEVDGKIYVWKNNDYVVLTDEEKNEIGFYTLKTKDWRTELYLQGTQSEPFGTESNYYYTELINEWPKLYDVHNGEFLEEVIKTPSDIDFYLDLIDTSASISQFSISNIGRRTKVLVDNNINCIFAPEIPDLVMIENGQEDMEKIKKNCEDKNQQYILVDSTIYKSLATGGVLNSAYDAICDLLYQYTKYNCSISLQTIPIYHLEVNTRIHVNDIQSNIYGDYIVNSITLPLGVGSNMSISATKVLEKM